MPMHVVNGATLVCSFGTMPSPLVVLAEHRQQIEEQFAANITDHVPLANILPFGMCTSLSNPEVAAATSAALGVLTPQPCIPATVAPWTPGSPTVLLDEDPALDDSSICTCLWAGVIAIADPGQATVQIP